MVPNTSVTIGAAGQLTHEEACRLARRAFASRCSTVILDLNNSASATTAALARLVLLRRELRQQGRELLLTGVRQQPARLLEVHRLVEVLPLAPYPQLPVTICLPSDGTHSTRTAFRNHTRSEPRERVAS